MSAADVPVPVLMSTSESSSLASLLSAFDMLLTADNTDAVVRRAIELARSRIGLDRVGIFLIDEGAACMLGTWGTDLNGAPVDERHVMFELGDSVLDVFRRAESEGKHFSVLDNCPIVVHDGATDVVGRGWVACTPIRSARARIGMMFNDVGLTRAPVDEEKQSKAAILCSLLGNMIELARARPGPSRKSEPSGVKHPIVLRALEMLSRDPALVGKQIATSLDISLSRLVRLFKAEVGLSLVEYRNRLRIERFQVLVGAREENLHEVARAAGFGSYAQFHRVFRAVYGTAPSSYLRAR